MHPYRFISLEPLSYHRLPQADEIGLALARIVRDEPEVKELWVSTHPEIHLWLVVGPMDLDTQRSLYLLTDPVYERFRSIDFEFHILNPREHRGDVHRALPPFAFEIPLRAD